jgi:N-acetylglucosaminyldiphosphoundecaprenol N-acetyl-beta-D-mannosaminyltransferase
MPSRAPGRGTGHETPDRINILGVQVSAINLDRALETVGGWIDRRERRYVCVASAHGVLECLADPDLKDVYNRSGMTTPDGMSLVWLLHLRGKRPVGRVYGPDLMIRLCELSVAKGWTHYLYGSTPDVLQALAGRLTGKFPGLRIAGTLSPPFRPLTPAEDREIVRTINESRPDIVWVGTGAPRQERWMSAHRKDIDAPVLIGVGAAFDFLSGRKPQAPRWIQRSGLEWLFRLATEPSRLWRRYAQYPRFAVLAAAQLLGWKKFD